MHVGREQCLSILRSQFWIPNCRGLIKNIFSNCFHCKRENKPFKTPFMSDIPKERLANNCKPFSHTGVDFFGPISVKLSRKTRANSATAKRYGALFTCLTTRAIHIEVCNDLSTDPFILASRRFKARRGQVKSIHCDNGTNFKGGERELEQALSRLDEKFF